jgi:hypothetical protein
MALLDDRVAEALCPLLLITGWTKLLWDAQLGPPSSAIIPGLRYPVTHPGSRGHAELIIGGVCCDGV